MMRKQIIENPTSVTTSICLLHLSDTQFGRHHRFGTASDEAFDSLLSRLADDLKVLRKEHDLKPQIVLLTGDLTEWGKKPEFDDVLKFSIGLSEKLSIPRSHFVIITGNHDINRDLCEAYFIACNAYDKEPQKPYWDKWRFYTEFFQEFYQEKTDCCFTQTEPWTLFEMPDIKIVVAGLNSTILESHRDKDHCGWLGEEQLRWFANCLEDYQQRGWFRIAALHHNLRRGPVKDDENLLDFKDFEKYLGSKVNLIVHCHTHDGKADWSINKVPILATGSAAVKAEQRPEEVPNQYQIIQLWPDRYQRWARCYFPENNTWGGDNRASNSLNSWQAEEAVSFADVRETFPLQELASYEANSIQLPRTQFYCNLPYASLGKLFKGRDNFISNLHNRILDQFDADNRAKPVAITQTPRQAICGLGGIGKTRLAVEYALRYADDYSALLFVVADSPKNLRSGVADLALCLKLKEATSKHDEETRFTAALRWLMEHPGWCLILDNVDTEDAAIECENLVSKLYGGHVIITSRLNVWSVSGIEALDLDVLDIKPSIELLLERTTKRFKADNDEQAAEELAGLVDGLALALEQAGAYINEEQCSIAEYIGHWKDGDKKVTGWYDERIMKYPKSVAITWNATIQAIGPAAEAILRLLSCFATAPIPTRILTCSESQEKMSLFLSGSSTDGQSENLSPKSLLTKLASFSMLKKTTGGAEQCIILHRVVHDITWLRVPDKLRLALLETAAELFDNIAPHEADRFESWAAWYVLHPHAEILWNRFQPYPKEHWNIRLLHGLALYYLGQNRHAEGEMLQRATYELMSQQMGENNPRTLQAKNDLALLLTDANESLRLLRETLEGLEKAYKSAGKPETEILLLECVFNVAVRLGDGAEDLSEAESLLRRCVAGFSASPEAGENHWRTLLSSRELAYHLHRTERQEEAGILARKTLTLSEMNPQLGPYHMDTLDSVRQVAIFLFKDGRLDEAVPLLQRELIGREQASELGPQHSSTWKCLGNLLEILWALHRTTEAEKLCFSKSMKWREIIGAEHPNMVACTQTLVRILAMNEKIGKARQIEVALNLALTRKQYYELQAKTGPEDQELLLLMKALADAQKDCGYLNEAESNYRRFLDGMRYIQCEDDEDIAIALNNYGLLLRDAGRLEDSLKCYQDALAIDEKLHTINEPSHPKIPHRLNNVSMVLLMLGLTDEAKLQLARAWSLKKSLHDTTSARILWVRVAVAMLSGEPPGVFLGQLKTVLELCEWRTANQVDNFWNVQSVVDYLNNKISALNGQLLATLVDVLNAPHFGLQSSDSPDSTSDSRSLNLNDFDLWKSQDPIKIEVPW